MVRRVFLVEEPARSSRATMAAAVKTVEVGLQLPVAMQ